MAKASHELLREWQEKQKRFEEAQEEYISVGTLPARVPRKALTEEALHQLDRLEREAGDAERAWRQALQLEAQSRR